MALSGSALAAILKPRIKTEIEAAFDIEGTFGADVLEKFAKAISDAIGEEVVTYLVANTVVNPGIHGLVTSGAGAGGNTVTDASGTIS